MYIGTLFLYPDDGIHAMRRNKSEQRSIRLILVMWLLLFMVGSLASCSRAPTGPGENDIKVLFIGNSLTYWNDMPGMFRTLAQMAGKDVYVRESTVGGSSIQFHASHPHTLDRIKLYDWDYVVLQESSGKVAFPSTQPEIIPYFLILKEHIWRYCPSARVIMFMDWSPEDGVDLQSGGHLSYTEFQQLIHDGTRFLAYNLEFSIAPIGWGWKEVYENRPTINLIDADEIHPSRAGSYLQACMYFATFFQESPVGINYLGSVNSSTARYMQSIAADIVLSDPGHWFLPEIDPR